MSFSRQHRTRQETLHVFFLFFVLNNRYTCRMDFEIKNLTLYNDLVFTKNDKNPVMKTEKLSIFTNCVKKNEMSPERSKYLTDRRWIGYGLVPETELLPGNEPDGVIPAGKYLFVQFFLDEKDEAKNQAMCEAAAEALKTIRTMQGSSFTEERVRGLAETLAKTPSLQRIKDQEELTMYHQRFVCDINPMFTDITVFVHKICIFCRVNFNSTC